MKVLDLPLPALECVIEHIVVTVGLYKAVRLRRVCSTSFNVPAATSVLTGPKETFDIEVRRAIFTTNLFHFDRDARVRYMSAEYLRLWLLAGVARPSQHHPDALSSAVIGMTKILLTGIPPSEYEERRLTYVHCLCDAIAHNFHHRFLDAMFETGNICLNAADNLLSAAAAVGDTDKVKHLLKQESASFDGASVFGHPSATAARKGDKQILAVIIQGSRQCEGQVIVTSLVAACGAGQQHTVEYLLSLPSQALLSDRDFEDSFEAAASSGHTNILRILFPRISQTRQDVVLLRSLQKASAHGHISSIQYLLHVGTDVNSWEPPGSALHFAANSGFSRVVRLLLDHGADPNFWAGRNGEPLYFAARNGHTEVVQILLEHGANINAKANIYTALSRAATNGELTMVKYLLDKGVDLRVRRQGNRALEEAARQGHGDIVRLLVDYGVDVNGTGRHNETPIFRAMLYGQKRIVRLLLQLGAKEQEPPDARRCGEPVDGNLSRS
ncbi:MAG: hypothetical protein Q9180_005248 [Flavoplaca navasiana]